MTTVTLELPSLSTEIDSAIQTEVNSNEDQPEPHSIVHAVRGRMRFHVPRLRRDCQYGHRLKLLLETEISLSSVRISQVTASLIVNYPVNQMAAAEIRSHMSYWLREARKPELAHLPSQLPVEVKQSGFDCQLSALATGLALLSGPFALPIPPLIIVSTICWATWPVLQRAVTGIIQQRQLTIDFLDLMTVGITACQGNYLTPALMLTLISLGEHIRDRTARSAQTHSLDLLGSWGQFVWIERDGEKQQIPLKEVEIGDTIIIHPGEQIPVDGSILRGKVLLDEQKLTGESIPVLKSRGNHVFASTLVREGSVYVLVERLGDNTRAGQSLKLIQEAPVHDTRMENYAAKLAQRAVLPTLLLGAGVFALTGNLSRTASILTLDFATGIRVSVPTTVLAALTYAAKQGILIRSGRALEKLAAVDTIIFDKTGTLTQGEVNVVGIESYSATVTQLELLELASAAEQCLLHPVAEAVMRHAIAAEIIIPSRSHWHYHLGLGVEAVIKGQQVLVGSDRFLRQQGVDMSGLEEESQSAESVVYIASDGQFVGKIRYRDVLRPESRAVIKQLLTVEHTPVHLLTGDQRHIANAVAQELGIPASHTHAEAFPAQKAEIVQRLHKSGKIVGFVGDGINDSPALAYADVSVSFANSSDIARETADVVLMDNDLSGLLTAMKIARQAHKLMQENTAIVAIPNLVALAIAVLFGLNPLTATLVNNGSTIVAGVNGLRPILGSSSKKNLTIAR